MAKDPTVDIFVEVEKDGEHLVVHPSTVDSHKRAGWKVVKQGVSLKGKVKEEEPKDETPKEVK